MAYKDVKTEHAFQAFHKDLKNGEFPPVIFMYGEEGYLIRWAVGELANLFVDSSSRSVDYLIADEIENVAELTQACDTFSIFSEKRVIWAKDFPRRRTGAAAKIYCRSQSRHNTGLIMRKT